MMISPESFYEMRLEGKTPEEIMKVIRSLKREISRLKRIMEHPDYKWREIDICPSEDVRLIMNREYLEEAKKALLEAGGEYIPSAAEQHAMKFEANIPYIKKVEFCTGTSMRGFTNRIFTIDDDVAHKQVEAFNLPVRGKKNKDIDKKYFLNSLKELHIGEWRKNYDSYRYGVAVMDGDYWDLKIYFSNGQKPVKIHGSNAYTYNFDRVLELFDKSESEAMHL